MSLMHPELVEGEKSKKLFREENWTVDDEASKQTCTYIEERTNKDEISLKMSSNASGLCKFKSQILLSIFQNEWSREVSWVSMKFNKKVFKV